MRFGAVPIAEAEGAIAVHSIRKEGLVLKKGTVIGNNEIAALGEAGIAEIVVARLEPGCPQPSARLANEDRREGTPAPEENGASERSDERRAPSPDRQRRATATAAAGVVGREASRPSSRKPGAIRA